MWCAKNYDSEEQTCWIKIKDEKEYKEEFQWKYDHLKLPDNEQLILNELFVTDFADNGQFSGVIEKLDYLLDLKE